MMATAAVLSGSAGRAGSRAVHDGSLEPEDVDECRDAVAVALVRV